MCLLCIIMDSSIRTSAVILILFVGICAGRDAKGFRNVVNPTNPSSEVTVGMKMRDLTEIDAFWTMISQYQIPGMKRGGQELTSDCLFLPSYPY